MGPWEPGIPTAPHPWIPACAGKTMWVLAGLSSYQSSMPVAASATDHENGAEPGTAPERTRLRHSRARRPLVSR